MVFQVKNFHYFNLKPVMLPVVASFIYFTGDFLGETNRPYVFRFQNNFMLMFTY